MAEVKLMQVERFGSCKKEEVVYKAPKQIEIK